MNTYTRFSLIVLCTFSTLSFSSVQSDPTQTFLERMITTPHDAPHIFTTLSPVDTLEDKDVDTKPLRSQLANSIQNFLDRVAGPHDTPHLFTTLSPVDTLGEMDTTVSEAREKAAKTWDTSEASNQKALDCELLAAFSFASGAAFTVSIPEALLPLAAVTKALPLIAGVAATAYLLEQAKKEYRHQQAVQR